MLALASFYTGSADLLGERECNLLNNGYHFIPQGLAFRDEDASDSSIRWAYTTSSSTPLLNIPVPKYGR